MKKNIIFATIPVDYQYHSSDERRTNWRQFVTLLQLENFPVQRLYLFVNPGNRPNIKLFYRELKSAVPHIKPKFILVRTEKNFSIATLMSTYSFFATGFPISTLIRSATTTSFIFRAVIFSCTPS